MKVCEELLKERVGVEEENIGHEEYGEQGDNVDACKPILDEDIPLDENINLFDLPQAGENLESLQVISLGELRTAT